MPPFNPNKPPTPPKQEKSQAELRQALEQSFFSLKTQFEAGEEEYINALNAGDFEDGEGEEEGTGERRKEKMQNELNAILDRAETIKAKLDNRETLPQMNPKISTTFEYKDDKGQTHQEQITLNIEDKLQEFTTLYQNTNIDLPPDFNESILDIWQRNQDEIEKEIQTKGFNEILIIPPNLSLPDLSEKLKMENGYYLGENLKTGGGFASITSPNTDKPRIILVHNVQNIIEDDKYGGKQTVDITGLNAQNHSPLSLEEYIIFQNKYHKETNQHLDEKGSTWLPSQVPNPQGGFRFIVSDWDPGNRLLNVVARVPSFRYSSLGVRPSRCFV